MNELVQHTGKKTLNIYGDLEDYESAQRISKSLMTSGCLPKSYDNVGACLILLDMAGRLNASPLMVAQNMHIIHGRPSWSSSYLIAGFNSSKAYTPITFRMGVDGKCKSVARDNLTCIAVTKIRETGEEILGTKITLDMAIAEGWYGKSGSKWVTMPEQMLKYRAAAFLIRTIAPEVAMGFQTVEEVRDMVDVTPSHKLEILDLEEDPMVNIITKEAPIIEDAKVVNVPQPEPVKAKAPQSKPAPQQDVLDDSIPLLDNEDGELFDPLINEAEKIKNLFSVKSTIKEVIELLNSPKVAEIQAKYPELYLQIEEEAQKREQELKASL